MKTEQLEIMKVIEFPKNNQTEIKLRNKKLDVAIRILEVLVEGGAEFHIVIDKKYRKLLFNDDVKLDYSIITTDEKEAQELIINNDNSDIFTIDGDELK